VRGNKGAGAAVWKKVAERGKKGEEVAKFVPQIAINQTNKQPTTQHTCTTGQLVAMEEAKGVDSGGAAAAASPNSTNTSTSPPSGAVPATPPPFEPTYTGATFFTTRLDTEAAPTPSTPPSDPLACRLALRDILQPASKLTAILLTAVKVDPHWLLKAGLASIPPNTRLSIITDKIALDGGGANDDEGDEEGEFRHAQNHGLPVVSRVERASQILNAGRPGASPPTIHKHDDRAPILHAKLPILRFGKRQGFARIVVCSANLYAVGAGTRCVVVARFSD